MAKTILFVLIWAAAAAVIYLLLIILSVFIEYMLEQARK